MSWATVRCSDRPEHLVRVAEKVEQSLAFLPPLADNDYMLSNRNDAYVHSTTASANDTYEVCFKRAESDEELIAILAGDGSLTDADDLSEFRPEVERDLLRALASYFIDFGVLDD
jgi:hypothetical protein